MQEEPLSVTVFLSFPYWLKSLEMKCDPQSETSNSQQLLGCQVTSRSDDGHGLLWRWDSLSVWALLFTRLLEI